MISGGADAICQRGKWLLHSWVQKMTIKEQIFVNQILVLQSRTRDGVAGDLQGGPRKQWQGRGPDQTITAVFFYDRCCQFGAFCLF